MITKLLTIVVALLGHLGLGGAPADEPTAVVAPAPAEVAAAPTPNVSKAPRVESTSVTITREATLDGDSTTAPSLPAISIAPSGVLLAPLTDAPRVAAGLTAKQVVGKIQDFYRATQHLQAKFRQTYTNNTFGKKSVSNGKVYVKKPGKMRWDYYKKSKTEKSFISDGKTLWAVEHHNKQVFIKDLKQNMLPVAVTFLYGKGDLSRDFKADLDASGKYGEKGDYVVKLTPKDPSQYKSLHLVVDKGNYRVKQSVVTESTGNINHFQFYEPDFKTAPPDTWFLYNVKTAKGYRIVKPKAPAK